MAGFTINCPESAETVMSDLREIGPSFLLRAASGVREFADPGHHQHGRRRSRQTLAFRPCHGSGKKCGADILDGKPVGLAMRLAYALGEVVIMVRCATPLGFSRLRAAYTAGAAIDRTCSGSTVP